MNEVVLVQAPSGDHEVIGDLLGLAGVEHTLVTARDCAGVKARIACIHGAAWDSQVGTLTALDTVWRLRLRGFEGHIVFFSFFAAEALAMLPLGFLTRMDGLTTLQLPLDPDRLCFSLHRFAALDPAAAASTNETLRQNVRSFAFPALCHSRATRLRELDLLLQVLVDDGDPEVIAARTLYAQQWWDIRAAEAVEFIVDVASLRSEDDAMLAFGGLDVQLAFRAHVTDLLGAQGADQPLFGERLRRLLDMLFER